MEMPFQMKQFFAKAWFCCV